MADAPGLNVLNDGAGEGIVGATTDLISNGVGVHGIINATGISVPPPAGHEVFIAGVLGEAGGPAGGPAIGVYGWAQAEEEGIGVYGFGDVGVSGLSLNGTGVDGQGKTWGVSGEGAIGVSGTGDDTGVAGSGKTGVYGTGGVGVTGNGKTYGTIGVSSGIGVLGWSGGKDAIGVQAVCPPGQGWAIVADGHSYLNGAAVVEQNLIVVDDLLVNGLKSAVVKARDGSHRALYCVESPESWFEDFGRARLVRGTARVSLDRMFAGVVRTGDYHVFLSPEGLCQGLYVARRARGGFEVRELHRGKSTVTFSYRIVARRKDVDAPRFKRVKLPTLPKPVRPPKLSTLKFPDISRTARRRQGTARLHRRGISKPIRRASGRRRSRAR